MVDEDWRNHIYYEMHRQHTVSSSYTESILLIVFSPNTCNPKGHYLFIAPAPPPRNMEKNASAGNTAAPLETGRVREGGSYRLSAPGGARDGVRLTRDL